MFVVAHLFCATFMYHTNIMYIGNVINKVVLENEMNSFVYSKLMDKSFAIFVVTRLILSRTVSLPVTCPAGRETGATQTVSLPVTCPAGRETGAT